MANIELSEPIAVPPEHVFAFFVPQRMPSWYGAEMDSTFEVQLGCAAEFSVGARVRISGRIGRKRVSQIAQVTAYEYARVLEWRFEDEYGVQGRERWELGRIVGAAGPGTVVKFTSNYALPGWFGSIVDRLVTRRAVTRRSREYLRRLARLVEHRT